MLNGGIPLDYDEIYHVCGCFKMIGGAIYISRSTLLRAVIPIYIESIPHIPTTAKMICSNGLFFSKSGSKCKPFLQKERG
jgi:hypothetical protein